MKYLKLGLKLGVIAAAGFALYVLGVYVAICAYFNP
jgi:hypothetical protein